MNVRLAKLRKMDEQLEHKDVEAARATLHSIMPRKTSDKKKATRARIRADTSRKIAKRRMTRGEIRAAVMERAEDHCENCGIPGWAWAPLELDHFHGGALKKSAESVKTCWALCGPCHRNKTNNDPSADVWVGRFKLHLDRNDLDVLLAERSMFQGTRAQPAQKSSSSVAPVRRGA